MRGRREPYLTLFARCGASRERVDADVAFVQIHELLAARGCTYVVPACDYAIALKAGEGFGDEMKVAAKLGVTAAEVDKLCSAVLDARGSGAKDPEELRQAVGGAARSL
jgi:hypothetical protein